MASRIGVVICVLAAILLYGTGKMILFWLAVISALVFVFVGLAASYIPTIPEIRRFKETVRQMELDGATDEEIIEYMNSPDDPANYDLDSVPNWIAVMALVALIAGIALLTPE